MLVSTLNAQVDDKEYNSSSLLSCLVYLAGLQLLQGVILGYVMWKQKRFDKSWSVFFLYTVLEAIFIFLKSTGRLDWLFLCGFF